MTQERSPSINFDNLISVMTDDFKLQILKDNYIIDSTFKFSENGKEHFIRKLERDLLDKSKLHSNKKTKTLKSFFQNLIK
jgi:hypothetical protein